MFSQASVILFTIGLMVTGSLLNLVTAQSIRILLECFLVTVHNEVAKVMFSHLSVCQWGGLPKCMLGYLPVSRHPPQEQTPPWEQTTPGADTSPGSRQPPQQTATAADGTHPTGMHSCSDLKMQHCIVSSVYQ